MRAALLKRSWLAIALALALLLGLGCGDDDDDGNNEETDPVALTLQGWAEFEALNWDGARTLFEAAIRTGSKSTESYSGAGWTYFMLGGNNATARTRWLEGLNGKTGGVNDIHFGLGSLDMLEEDYVSAIEHFETVLDRSPTYTFIHQPGINKDDLYLALADCYYKEADFENSLANVKMINSSFDADVSTVEGVTALGQEIDRLTTRIG